MWATLNTYSWITNIHKLPLEPPVTLLYFQSNTNCQMLGLTEESMKQCKIRKETMNEQNISVQSNQCFAQWSPTGSQKCEPWQFRTKPWSEHKANSSCKCINQQLSTCRDMCKTHCRNVQGRAFWSNSIKRSCAIRFGEVAGFIFFTVFRKSGSLLQSHHIRPEIQACKTLTSMGACLTQFTNCGALARLTLYSMVWKLSINLNWTSELKLL